MYYFKLIVLYICFCFITTNSYAVMHKMTITKTGTPYTRGNPSIEITYVKCFTGLKTDDKPTRTCSWCRQNKTTPAPHRETVCGSARTTTLTATSTISYTGYDTPEQFLPGGITYIRFISARAIDYSATSTFSDNACTSEAVRDMPEAWREITVISGTATFSVRSSQIYLS